MPPHFPAWKGCFGSEEPLKAAGVGAGEGVQSRGPVPSQEAPDL